MFGCTFLLVDMLLSLCGAESEKHSDTYSILLVAVVTKAQFG